MLTCPQLFAGLNETGTETCFFCGGQCGDEHTAKKYVKDSFTERDQVACGSSDYVCGGCVAAMDERATITLIDGEVRKDQKTRNYSWVITEDRALAATKAHREQLRELCLNPPKPPYAICLADGQKHQLFKTQVCTSRLIVSVNVEGTIATFSKQQLVDRLAIVQRLIGCAGKPDVSAGLPSRILWPRLTNSMSPSEIQIVCPFWDRVRNEPLTRLACWVAAGKGSM